MPPTPPTIAAYAALDDADAPIQLAARVARDVGLPADAVGQDLFAMVVDRNVCDYLAAAPEDADDTEAADRLVFVVEDAGGAADQYYFSQRSTLAQLCADESVVRYRCRRVDGGMLWNNVVLSDSYAMLRALGIGHGGIARMGQFTELLDNRADLRAVRLVQNGRSPAVVSKHIMRLMAVDSDSIPVGMQHCQDGTDQKIYTLHAASADTAAAASTAAASTASLVAAASAPRPAASAKLGTGRITDKTIYQWIWECIAPFDFGPDEDDEPMPAELSLANIPDWDVSAVTDFSALFALKDGDDPNVYPVPDVSRWDMSGAVSLDAMFMNCASFNQPIGDWNVSSVRCLARTFRGCTSFAQILDKWDVRNVERFDLTFDGATAFVGDARRALRAWAVGGPRANPHPVNLVLVFGDRGKSDDQPPWYAHWLARVDAALELLDPDDTPPALQFVYPLAEEEEEEDAEEEDGDTDAEVDAVLRPVPLLAPAAGDPGVSDASALEFLAEDEQDHLVFETDGGRYIRAARSSLKREYKTESALHFRCRQASDYVSVDNADTMVPFVLLQSLSLATAGVVRLVQFNELLVNRPDVRAVRLVPVAGETFDTAITKAMLTRMVETPVGATLPFSAQYCQAYTDTRVYALQEVPLSKKRGRDAAPAPPPAAASAASAPPPAAPPAPPASRRRRRRT